MSYHGPMYVDGLVRYYPRLPRKQDGLGLIQDRIDFTGPNATHVIAQHDLDIPEGYVIEIWGVEIMSNGFLDTGGTMLYFCSLDDDVITATVSRTSDDVFFAGTFETLLVTTGGGMVVSRDRAFFPHPIVTARDVVQWIIYSATDWSGSWGSLCLHFRYRKATDKDITELLLRRR